MGFLYIRVYFLYCPTLYYLKHLTFTAQQYVLLSLLKYIITSSSHHTSNKRTSKAKSSKLNSQFQYIVCLLDGQNTLLIFHKFPSNRSRLTKRSSGTTLVHLRSPFGPFKSNILSSWTCVIHVYL